MRKIEPKLYVRLIPIPVPNQNSPQHSFFYFPEACQEGLTIASMAAFTAQDDAGLAEAAQLTVKQASEILKSLRKDMEDHHALTQRIDLVKSRSARNRKLLLMLRLSEQLGEAIGAMDQDTLASLSGARFANIEVEQKKDPVWINWWQHDLDAIRRLTADIRLALDAPRTGRPPARAFVSFLQRAAAAFEQASGRQAGRIIDPKSGTPSGPFHHAVKFLLAKAGSELTDHGVDRILKSFLAAQKKRARKPTA